MSDENSKIDSGFRDKTELPVLVKVESGKNLSDNTILNNEDLKQNFDIVNQLRQQVSQKAQITKRNLEKYYIQSEILDLPVSEKDWEVLLAELNSTYLRTIYEILSFGRGVAGLPELVDYKKFSKTRFDNQIILQKLGEYNSIFTHLINNRKNISDIEPELNKLKQLEAEIKVKRQNNLNNQKSMIENLVQDLSKTIKDVVGGNSEWENAFLNKGQPILDTDFVYLDGELNLNQVTSVRDLLDKTISFLDICVDLVKYDHTKKV
jgi:hypothetical protein